MRKCWSFRGNGRFYTIFKLWVHSDGNAEACTHSALWRRWVSCEELWAAVVLLARQFLLWQWIQGAVASTHCISSPIAYPIPLTPFNSQFIKWTPLFRSSYTSDCLIRIWLCMGGHSQAERECPGHSHVLGSTITNCRLLFWYFGFMHWTCEFV